MSDQPAAPEAWDDELVLLNARDDLRRVVQSLTKARDDGQTSAELDRAIEAAEDALRLVKAHGHDGRWKE